MEDAPEEQEVIEDGTPLIYHLFVKFVIKNKQNRNDWIYSTTAEISDAEIVKCLENKEVTEITFPFDRMLRLSMECKIEFTCYWKNSEGVRSENVIIYSEIHTIDEQRQKMFVKEHSRQQEPIAHIELFSSSEEEDEDEEEKDQTIDIFASKKEKEKQLALLRQKKKSLSMNIKDKDQESKRKLNHDENTIKTFKDETEEQKYRDDDDQQYLENPNQVLTVVEQPTRQNESGAYQMQELTCLFDIKKVLSTHFPDVEEHFNKTL